MTAPLVQEPIQFQFIYWSIAITLVLCAAAWKAASMRGNLHDTWADRVDAFKTGLSEGAILELRDLRGKIDELLGAEGDIPVSTIADPAILLQSLRKFERLLGIYRKIDPQFNWLLKLGNVLVVSLVITILGIIGAALDLSNLVQFPHQLLIAGILLCVGVSSCVICFIFYWLLQNKLSEAEILSRSVAE